MRQLRPATRKDIQASQIGYGQTTVPSPVWLRAASYSVSASVCRDGGRELSAGHEGARITDAASARALRMLASRSSRSARSGVWSACRLV